MGDVEDWPSVLWGAELRLKLGDLCVQPLKGQRTVYIYCWLSFCVDQTSNILGMKKAH